MALERTSIRAAVAPRTAGRRERRAAETREKIYRAAIELFAERGFNAVTVEDITEAADVGKGTFFNYFPTKEHVLSTLGDIQVAKLERELEAHRAGNASLPEFLTRFARAMSEEPGRSPQVMRSMLAAVLTSEAMRQVMLEKVSRGRHVMAELLALGQKRGDVRRDRDAREMARVCQQACFGTMLMWALDVSAPLNKHFEETMELLWRGFAARPRGAGSAHRVKQA